jgi:hypothetical protein
LAIDYSRLIQDWLHNFSRKCFQSARSVNRLASVLRFRSGSPVGAFLSCVPTRQFCNAVPTAGICDTIQLYIIYCAARFVKPFRDDDREVSTCIKEAQRVSEEVGRVKVAALLEQIKGFALPISDRVPAASSLTRRASCGFAAIGIAP